MDREVNFLGGKVSDMEKVLEHQKTLRDFLTKDCNGMKKTSFTKDHSYRGRPASTRKRDWRGLYN